MNIVKVGIFSIFGLLAGCIVLFIGGRYYYQTTKLDYCVRCHEMSTQYESFKTSFHYNEVVKNCQSCHIGKGVIAFVRDKATRDPKDWLEHLKGSYANGEFIDISEKSLEIVNESCIECHSEGYTKDATHLDMISMARKKV
ncbi:MAG: NapC/NirT family cytochrome c, partial [Planctomycetes bacterium]|nr:NapC/NirT family cytochrome c [Planctomycetota bacterium]